MGWLSFISGVTGDSSSKVATAGHVFRDDSGAREGKDSDNFKSAPDWAESSGSSGVDYFPDGKGPSS